MARFRAVELFPKVDLTVAERGDGTLVLTVPPVPMASPRTLAGRLAAQAAALGEKSLIAARDDAGEWRHVSYAEAQPESAIGGVFMRQLLVSGCRRLPVLRAKVLVSLLRGGGRLSNDHGWR